MTATIPGRGTDRGVSYFNAVALGLLLLFGVLAFAMTEQWALSIFEVGVFALGIWSAFTRSWSFQALAMPLYGAAALALGQVLTGKTVYRFATANALLNWTAYAMLFMVSAAALSNEQIRRRFLSVCEYCGCGVALLSVAQHFTSAGYIYWIFPVRIGSPFGPFVNPDHFAAFVELLLPVAISKALRDPRRAWVHTAIAGALYGSVIASGSRAGWVIATLEILVIPLLAGRLRIVAKTFASLIFCAVLASGVAGWDVLWKRFQDNDPFRYRREILASTFRMINRHPWTGYGLGTFPIVYPEFATFDLGLVVDHAHNDWAEWTAEGGLPMLFLTLALPAMAIRPAIRSVWGLGICAVWLHSLVDFPMQIPTIAALTFALLGALSGDQRTASLRKS